MTCDICKRHMNYCFYVNDEHWMKAVGRVEGHVCAHCILEKLGGLDWMIIWNEPTERIRKNMESTKEDGYTKRERGHVNYCGLASDHEGDCARATEHERTDVMNARETYNAIQKQQSRGRPASALSVTGNGPRDVNGHAGISSAPVVERVSGVAKERPARGANVGWAEREALRDG